MFSFDLKNINLSQVMIKKPSRLCIKCNLSKIIKTLRTFQYTIIANWLVDLLYPLVYFIIFFMICYFFINIHDCLIETLFTEDMPTLTNTEWLCINSRCNQTTLTRGIRWFKVFCWYKTYHKVIMWNAFINKTYYS